MHNESSHFLTINGGSSSIKFAIFDAHTVTKVLEGKIDRIGMEGTALFITNLTTQEKTERAVSESEIISVLISSITEHVPLDTIHAIGHRIVHGGNTYYEPTLITDHVIHDLEGFSPFAPLHLPNQIALITACTEHFPHTPQIALFDTGFHHHLPEVAQTLPLPRKYKTEGVRRYGYHGLSCEYLLHTLQETLGVPVEEKKIIIAHLGNGSSLTAIQNGKSVETSMGFSPNSGIPMSTRSGDLEPGLFAYFLKTRGMSLDQFEHMVNHESGVVGISDSTADMEVLLQNAPHDPHAAEAIRFYVYHVKKQIGALTAVLGGVDILIFSGGIGEGGYAIRKSISEGLAYLGIEIDASQNETNMQVISSAQSRVILYVIPTDEELIMAHHMHQLLHTHA